MREAESVKPCKRASVSPHYLQSQPENERHRPLPRHLWIEYPGNNQRIRLSRNNETTAVSPAVDCIIVSRIQNPALASSIPPFNPPLRHSLPSPRPYGSSK